MYRIDTTNNEISRLQQSTFSEHGFGEREHLQEWIAKSPDVLGEELLIIQKEFAGFSDTWERLDLLALDKQGSLVIIENKLDDSGRDVTWQALKYASYCSGLSRDNIRKIYQQYLDKYEPGAKAEEKLSEFYDSENYKDISLNKSVTQRIILVAANFRKEVTSTVLWLMNFKIRLQCFRATPYSMGDELFLTFNQIIPVPDTEDYMIGMAEKAQDDIDAQTELKHDQILRREFWTQLLQALNSKSDLWRDNNPHPGYWMGAKSGIDRVVFQFFLSKRCRAGIYISGNKRDESEFIFDELFKKKEELEAMLGESLEWDRGKRDCQIKWEVAGDVYDKECWDDMIESLTNNMVKLEKAFAPYLDKVNEQLAHERKRD